MVGLAQNTLLLALLLTMAAGIVLGMGMPTTPAYIIMVSLLVPALVKLGVVKPAAHMFAFYFAILSAITPPVALAVYAAAGLAKSDIWKTGWAAVKVGAAGLRRALHVRLRAGAADDRRLADHRLALRRCRASASACWRRGCTAICCEPMPLLGARRRHRRRALLLVAPELTTDIVGLALMAGLLPSSTWAHASPSRRRSALRPPIAAQSPHA